MKFKRRSGSLLLTLCFVLSLLVAFKGEVKYVNAEENSNVYMITIEGTYGDNYSYASKAFFDEDFDCVWEYRIPGRNWMVVDNGDSVTFCRRYNNHRVEVNFWPGFVDEKSLESNKH